MTQCNGKKANFTCKCWRQKGETYFSEFAFDILALLKGTYQPHVLSSLHCIGSTTWENGSCVETRYADPEAVKRYREETAAILKAKGFVGFEPSDL